MRTLLILLFIVIFVCIVTANIRAQSQVSFMDFPAWQPAFAANPWAVATLWDCYLGFLTFFVWVCFKERALWAKILWFVLIMGAGNIAMSVYVLIQLFRLKPGEPVRNVLLRREA